MKRKLTLILLLAMTILLLCSCGNSRKASAEDVEFLIEADCWYHYNEVSCNEKMRFSDDFSFYWGCECGEPVGDSDLYELYDYDSETRTIRLYNDYDNSSMELKVLDYSDYHLLLEYDGEIKDYLYIDPNLYIEESETYLSGYDLYATVIEEENGSVILGPFNYDGDIEYPDNAMKSYSLAENVQFFDLDVETTVKNDEEQTKVSYREIASCPEDASSVFVWLNSEMEIEKMVFYGALTVWR